MDFTVSILAMNTNSLVNVRLLNISRVRVLQRHHLAYNNNLYSETTAVTVTVLLVASTLLHQPSGTLYLRSLVLTVSKSKGQFQCTA